ncbi:TPR repeat protein [Devosia sp. UYZn731]|uniref:hypothetical protein n=1 Tax=Devosia sp. UYZn731 TaxID=3156345 RepID=UPI0033983441
MRNLAWGFAVLGVVLLQITGTQAQPVGFSQFNFAQGAGLPLQDGLGDDNLATRIRQLGNNSLDQALPIAGPVGQLQIKKLDEAAKLRFSFDPQEAERGTALLGDLERAGNPLAGYLNSLPTDAQEWTQDDYLADFTRNQTLADEGQPLAQRLVATDYLKGTIVPLDLLQARRGFETLTENPALNELDAAQQIQALQLAAEANRFGIAGKADLARSAELWQRGIELGDPVSMVSYSDQLLAKGGAEDLVAAFGLLNRAAGLGDTRATIKALSYADKYPTGSRLTN